MDFLQGKYIIHKDNESVLSDTCLKKKNLILYYFTAFDCDACRKFDEKLRQIYSEACVRKVELAIVIVCCEQDKNSFVNNIKTNYYDWYALRYEDDLNHILYYNYGVSHMPALVVVRKNGTVVTRTGVQEIQQIGINVLVTWSE